MCSVWLIFPNLFAERCRSKTLYYSFKISDKYVKQTVSLNDSSGSGNKGIFFSLNSTLIVEDISVKRCMANVGPLRISSQLYPVFHTCFA